MILLSPAPISLNCACGILRSKGQGKRLWSQPCVWRWRQTPTSRWKPKHQVTKNHILRRKASLWVSKSFVFVSVKMGNFSFLSFRIILFLFLISFKCTDWSFVLIKSRGHDWFLSIFTQEIWVFFKYMIGFRFILLKMYLRILQSCSKWQWELPT